VKDKPSLAEALIRLQNLCLLRDDLRKSSEFARETASLLEHLPAPLRALGRELEAVIVLLRGDPREAVHMFDALGVVRATKEEIVANPEGRALVTREATGSFYAMVASFARRYRKIRVQLDVSTRVVDLLRDGYDVALRAAYQVQPGLVARSVARGKVYASRFRDAPTFPLRIAMSPLPDAQGDRRARRRGLKLGTRRRRSPLRKNRRPREPRDDRSHEHAELRDRRFVG
jgi:hypothetical protein